MSNQRIQAERPEPTYYARVPKMALQDLGPYELALYTHYKQACSDDPDGKCFKSNETLAQETKMSVNRLKQARNNLAALDYIFIERHTATTGKGTFDKSTVTVTVADVWAINHARQNALNEARGVSRGDRGVSPDDRGVSRGDTKEEPFKKNPLGKEEKDFDDAKAPSPSTPAAPKSAPRGANPWYDAIKATWGFTGGRNGGMEKLLRGTATSKTHKAYNLETPLTDPAQLADWKRWYLNVKMRGKPDTILPSAVDKVQSSIGEWQAWLEARQTPATSSIPAYVPPAPTFSADVLERASAWRQGEVARLKALQQQVAS